MLIEISYMHGLCPLCGGSAVSINPIDSARDIDTQRNDLMYMNFVAYSVRCDRCSFMWYVRTYSWISADKSGYATRRNYVDHVDYKQYKPLLVDMAYVKEGTD
jgi:hypothetical protein